MVIVSNMNLSSQMSLRGKGAARNSMWPYDEQHKLQWLKRHFLRNTFHYLIFVFPEVLTEINNLTSRKSNAEYDKKCSED